MDSALGVDTQSQTAEGDDHQRGPGLNTAHRQHAVTGAEQPARGGCHDDRPGLGQGLKAGCKVRRLPDHSVLPQRTRAAKVANHHHAGRDANANRERFCGPRTDVSRTCRYGRV